MRCLCLFQRLDDLFQEKWSSRPSGGCNFWGRNRGNTEHKKSSLQARNRVNRHFAAYFASKEPAVEVDFLIELAKDGDVIPLEKALIEFFQTLCVNKDGKNRAPKRSTVECYKSHIKMSILEKTERKVDLGNSVRFRHFHKFYSEFSGPSPKV